MDLARQVQSRLLPQKSPSIPGLDLWGVSQPASQVGGDFYDFVAPPGQPLTFFVGDVCGMGLPAALLMPMTRAVIRWESNLQPVPTPETILQSANQKLLADLMEAGMFATAFVGQYNPFTGELLYASAGHSPVIFYPAGGRAYLLEADGQPLGVLAESLSRDHDLHVRAGDVLVVATDGLNEAHNVFGERFGIERLLQRIQETGTRPACEISACLLDEIREFHAPLPPSDDQTIVVLRCTEHFP